MGDGDSGRDYINEGEDGNRSAHSPSLRLTKLGLYKEVLPARIIQSRAGRSTESTRLPVQS